MASKKHFFISLEGVDLTDQQLKNIDKGIQNVVLSELSKVDNTQSFITQRDLKGFTKPLRIKEWFPWGIIILNPGLDPQIQIKDLQAQIKKYGG